GRGLWQAEIIKENAVINIDGSFRGIIVAEVRSYELADSRLNAECCILSPVVCALSLSSLIFHNNPCLYLMIIKL
ncbi:MAG: hypothetical protein JXK95_07705, partial [Bacteroidales bacterium]|nr:hypothetical protein [Bacteroidales bacterium]